MARELPKFLEPTELSGLLDAAQASSPIHYALVVVMAYAGLRVAEACALQWRDIGERRLLVRRGKGGKQRYVPLHPRLQAALEAVRPFNQERTDYIFPSNQRPGSPMTTRWAQRIVKRLCLSVDIEDERAHPHVLRHSFATNTYRAKRNILATQRLLGHASVATTQVYTHLVTDDLEETVDALE